MPLARLLVVALTAVAYGTAEIPTHVFPADSELIYNYLAHVSAGTTQPQDYLSHYSIQGKLRVQTSGEKAKFRLEDVLFSTYNGKGNQHKLPSGDYVSIPVPQDAKEITKPFVAIFDNGKVTSFEYETTDSLWSRNLKRSIVTQFQVDLKEFSFEVPKVFTSEEIGISGECKVENILVYTGKLDSYTLRKSEDASRCKTTKYWYDNLSLSTCSTEETKSPMSKSTERNYDLKVEKSNLLIRKIKSRSVVSFQPLWIKGELQYIFINQTFKLESQGPIPVPLIVGDTSPSTLTFEFQDSASGTGPDMFFERYSMKMDELIAMTLQSLVKSAEAMAEDPEADVSKLHNINSHNYLLAFMRHLDYDAMKKLADNVLLGTSYTDETIREIFLSFLPKAGTKAAILLIRDLVTQEKLTMHESIIVLADLPFHMRYPTAPLLKECQDFLNLGGQKPEVQKAALLTFATMVGKICQSGACSPALLDEYVKLYFGRLRDAKEYDEQLLYIQALGNIQIGPVGTYLEPIIRGKLNYPRQLRFQAVWAISDELIKTPEKVYEIFWPILADRRNHLEMRIASLTLLLMAQPTTERFMNILWFMVSDPDYQLYQYFYTTIKSLTNSRFPCYSKLSTAAQQISKMVPKPKHSPSFLTTSNEIIDFVDPDLEMGQMFQLVSIGSERSDMCDVMYLHYTKHLRGQVHNPLSVFLRIEGFDEIRAKKTMVPGEETEENYSKLQAMFAALKIKPRTSDPVHVEFILKIQGRAVVSHYFNSTGIYQMASVFENLQKMSLSRHLNYQSLQHSVFFESIFPSDIGAPISIETSTLPLLSLRGNLSYSFKAPVMSANVDLNAKFSIRQGYGVRIFNPIAALWNGIHRPSVHIIKAPINFGASFDLLQKTLKARFGWTKDSPFLNVVSHGRSKSFVTGDQQKLIAVLPQTCPDCKSWEEIHAPTNPSDVTLVDIGKNVNLKWTAFDCDKKMDLATPFIKPLFMKRFSNYGLQFEDSYESINPALVMGLQTEMLVGLDRLINSCGSQFKLTPLTDTSGVEFVLKAENSKGNKKLYRFITNFLKSGGEVANSWDTNIIAEPSEDRTKFGMKVKVVQKQDGRPVYVSCLKLDNTYPVRGPETYWDQLGGPFESRRTEHRLAMEFGVNEEGKCPVGKGMLEVTASTEHQGLDESIWPFNICQEQRQRQNFVNEDGKLLYPATFACATASWGPRPRNVTFSINFANVPMLDAVFKNDSMPDPLLFSKSDSSSYKLFVDTMHSLKNSSMLVNIRSDQGKKLDFTLPLAFNKAPFVVSETLAHYPSFEIVQMALDMARPCLIAGGKVLTFDNSSLPFNAQDEFTLISGVCTEDSPFAVFARKTEGTSALTVKVFLDGSEILIEPIKGKKSKITLNGAVITTDNVLEKLSIKQKEDGKVDIKHADESFYVRSTDINLAVIVPSTFDRYYCGVCGDSNDVPEYIEIPGPENKMVSVDDMTAAYTVN